MVALRSNPATASHTGSNKTDETAGRRSRAAPKTPHVTAARHVKTPTDTQATSSRVCSTATDQSGTRTTSSPADAALSMAPASASLTLMMLLVPVESLPHLPIHHTA